MSNNLFISHSAKGLESLATIAETIGRFGDAVQLHASLWYLRTRHTGADVAEAVWPLMDPDDCLVVIDATNDTTAWFNVSPANAARVEKLGRT